MVSITRLVDYAENRLAGKALARVEATLGTDPEAQATVAWVRQFIADSARIQLPKPPPHVMNNLLAAHQRKYTSSSKPSAAESWRFLRGILSFDSYAGLAGAALRSGADMARQLQYRSELVDVALDIATADNGYLLNGQLLWNIPENPQCTVQVIQDDLDIGITASDTLGQFLLEVPTLGHYEMVVLTSSFELTFSLELV